MTMGLLFQGDNQSSGCQVARGKIHLSIPSCLFLGNESQGQFHQKSVVKTSNRPNLDTVVECALVIFYSVQFFGNMARTGPHSNMYGWM